MRASVALAALLGSVLIAPAASAQSAATKVHLKHAPEHRMVQQRVRPAPERVDRAVVRHRADHTQSMRAVDRSSMRVTPRREPVRIDHHDLHVELPPPPRIERVEPAKPASTPTPSAQVPRKNDELKQLPLTLDVAAGCTSSGKVCAQLKKNYRDGKQLGEGAVDAAREMSLSEKETIEGLLGQAMSQACARLGLTCAAGVGEK